MMPQPPGCPRRLAFLGSPEAAVGPLRAVVEAGYEVGAVVTGRPKRRGRGAALSPTPVGEVAAELGIDVRHDPSELQGAGFDLGIVVAFGRLLRAPLLAELPLVNVHFSLLPRWRGAAPVERALLAGDPETGVCLMQVVEELDAGPVYRRAVTVIGPHDTAGELRARLSILGTGLLLDALADGFGDPSPQTGATTYAAKLTREDLQLHWAEPAMQLGRVVRVGGAWTAAQGVELKVWRAEPLREGSDAPPGTVVLSRRGAPVVVCGEGALTLEEVQPAGKGRVEGASWARGLRGAVVLGP